MVGDRTTGADSLRLLRESRGWSWADLARVLRDTARGLGVTSVARCRVESIQRAIARWESRDGQVRPGERYQFLLAHLYARTSSGDIAIGPGSDFAGLLDALRQLGVAEPRIGQLVGLTVRVAGDGADGVRGLLSPGVRSTVVGILRRPSSLDRELLDQLSAEVETIKAQVGSVPFVRLQIGLAPVAESCRQLVHATRSRPNPDLLALASASFALAGRLAFETHDDVVALASYREASELAGRLGDRRHRAAVRTSHAMVTLHATADVATAHGIAQKAVHDACRGSSYSVRARAHAVHAETCARGDGRSSQARAALDQSWTAVQQHRREGVSGEFNAERLDGFDGLCALHAGEARRAHDQLTRSVGTLRGPRDELQYGIVSSDLALAQLRLGDPAACVETLHRAVATAARAGGRVAAQRIRQTRRELRPWRTEAFVADLDDHIHEALIGS